MKLANYTGRGKSRVYDTGMTPVRRCLHKVDHLSAVSDSTVASRVDAALDELEQAYRRPSERIVALEAVLQEVCRDYRTGGTPLGRFRPGKR